MVKPKLKIFLICTSFLLTLAIPVVCTAMDRPPEGPTAIVVDDETGKPIEGAVALAIWRGSKDCTLVQGLEGGCWGFNRAEETISDKEGRIYIKDFWKTTKGPGKWGSAHDPRLTVYKFGYVCWDQKDIFAPGYHWSDRKDFNEKHRIVRLKKWQESFSSEEHSSFISGVTLDGYFKTSDQLFIKERWPKRDKYSGKKN